MAIHGAFEPIACRQLPFLGSMLTNLEAVFRSLKTDLGLRPVHHPIERRVEGHLFISVLAYYIVHTIRLQLKGQGLDHSWQISPRS